MEMLKIHNNPPRREWPALTARCTRQEGEITERVAAILSQVRTGGDKALRDLVARYTNRPQDVAFDEEAGPEKTSWFDKIFH